MKNNPEEKQEVKITYTLQNPITLDHIQQETQQRLRQHHLKIEVTEITIRPQNTLTAQITVTGTILQTTT